MSIIDWREILITTMFHIISILRIDRVLRLNKLALIKGTSYPITDYFKGLEKVQAVRQIFGDKTEEVLRNLQIEFTWIGGYMWVNSADGHIMVDARYLNKGDKIDVYLDLIHELVHVKQFMEGKKLFDNDYSYVERPTEVEAYRFAVEEARRLGLTDERICQYLKTEWMSNGDLKKLAKTLKVRCA
ncbi:MAG: hypothetical protein OEZ40_04925 [Candidatus Bathyarchaeota archaeon]|nr:hypothetical protein [Candidatus Bathyarchaeota archaeon]